MTEESRRFLLDLPALATLDDVDRTRLAGCFEDATFPPRRFLYREGEPAPALHLVVRGHAKLSRSSPEGRELVMSLVGPGDICGPCCDPFAAAPAGCTAMTVTPVTMLLMPARTWKQTATAAPAIGFALASLMMKSRRGCTDLASRLVFQSVEQRLAALLRSLTRWSPAGAPLEVPRLLTHSEMAQAVGSAREVVTRCLTRFEEQGLIRRIGRRILLTNVAALAGVEDSH